MEGRLNKASNSNETKLSCFFSHQSNELEWPTSTVALFYVDALARKMIANQHMIILWVISP